LENPKVSLVLADNNIMNTNTETGKLEVRLTLRGKGLLDAKLEKLNRRAKRLGVPPVQVQQLTAWERIESAKDESTGLSRVVDMAYFSVSVEVPSLAGWRFLATLEHMNGTNLIKKSPTIAEETNLETYRTCGPTCEHCNKPRNRADTYVIENLASAKRMQVGSNCLADVLGLGATPEQAAQWAEWIQSIDLASLCGEGDNDFEGGGGRVLDAVPLLSFLEVCAALVRVDGYRSRKYAEASEGRVASTAHDALFHYDPPHGMSSKTVASLKERYGSFPIEPGQSDRDEAKAAVAWALAITPKSDFDWNLKALAGQEMMGLRNAGIAAYLIAGYRRAMELEVERKARNAALPPSEHVGELGKRIKGATVVYLATPFAGETQYGPLFIHKFRDTSGNDIVWKTSTSMESETPGREFKADFTPKKHDDYKGRKQTEVSRMKLA
jgi:hypothetical protein